MVNDQGPIWTSALFPPVHMMGLESLQFMV